MIMVHNMIKNTGFLYFYLGEQECLTTILFMLVLESTGVSL